MKNLLYGDQGAARGPVPKESIQGRTTRMHASWRKAAWRSVAGMSRVSQRRERRFVPNLFRRRGVVPPDPRLGDQVDYLHSGLSPRESVDPGRAPAPRPAPRTAAENGLRE